MIRNVTAFMRSLGLEPFLWTAALGYFALIDPSTTPMFSLCPLHNLGFPYCPGCGLGRSISFLLHGDVGRSFGTHILGIPATLIIVTRVFSIGRSTLERRLFIQPGQSQGNGNG